MNARIGFSGPRRGGLPRRAERAVGLSHSPRPSAPPEPVPGGCPPLQHGQAHPSGRRRSGHDVRHPPALTLIWVLLGGLLWPAAGGAQPAAPAPDALTRADRLYASGRSLESLEAVERFLRDRPRAYGALWRAARAAVSLGLLEETKAAQNGWYLRGADYGRRAANAEPDRVEGHYWLAANAGLHALQASRPGRIADLGEEVHRAATKVLELDPRHAGAHNVLGRLETAIMELSSLERAIGRHLLGSEAIAFATWEGARRHLVRAVELDPDVILYRLDLGRLLLKRNAHRKAAAHLRVALRLEPVHPPDPRFQDRARELLREHGRDLPAGSPAPVPGSGAAGSGRADEAAPRTAAGHRTG